MLYLHCHVIVADCFRALCKRDSTLIIIYKNPTNYEWYVYKIRNTDIYICNWGQYDRTSVYKHGLKYTVLIPCQPTYRILNTVEHVHLYIRYKPATT